MLEQLPFLSLWPIASHLIQTLTHCGHTGKVQPVAHLAVEVTLDMCTVHLLVFLTVNGT